MPAWLISFLISLAVKFGVPFLLSKMPWIPDEVKKIIEDLIGKLAGHKAERTDLVQQAKKDIQKACEGVACKPDLKGE